MTALLGRHGAWLAYAAIALLLGATLVVRLSQRHDAADGHPSRPVTTSSVTKPAMPTPAVRTPQVKPVPEVAEVVRSADQWVRGVFGQHRCLVAYYGTAETGALGVLGETSPDEMQRRVSRAARAFGHPRQPVQVVYELIVTIADRSPGPDRSYSHDIDRRLVQRYLRAAHRHRAMLVLDLQPGRTPFDVVAKRWAWALRDPYVGLALDPEWRMHASQVPASVIGRVGSSEINRTSLWLTQLQRRYDLPQKLFVLHQFRRDMIYRIQRVRPRDGLAMVQHVDGFGTPGQKLATFHSVARPRQFVMGFKLFYDEDLHRMGPGAVRRIRPSVRFVSFQ